MLHLEVPIFIWAVLAVLLTAAAACIVLLLFTPKPPVWWADWILYFRRNGPGNGVCEVPAGWRCVRTAHHAGVCWCEKASSKSIFPPLCDRPPKGWWCSLQQGHAGPCPTRRVPWIVRWF